MLGLTIFTLGKVRTYDTGYNIKIVMLKVGPQDNPSQVYPFHELPSCCVNDSTKYRQTFADALIGNAIMKPGFSIKMKTNEERKIICRFKPTEKQIAKMKKGVYDNYWIKFFIDSLPAYCHYGTIQNGNPAVFSHFAFSFTYNNNQIIEVNVSTSDPVDIAENIEFDFTYSVNWIETNQTYSTRFLRYLDTKFFEHIAHYYSIINSAVLCSLLLVITGIIIGRIFIKDFNKINGESFEGFEFDISMEKGWKTLHGDVFRPPSKRILVASLSGAGVQVAAFLITFAFANYSFNYYQKRVGMIRVAITIFVFSAPIAGFIGVTLCRVYNEQKWLSTSLISGSTAPIIAFILELISTINSMVSHTSKTVPLTSILGVLFVIVCIILPLSGFGGFIGRKLKLFEGNKCEVSLIPRRIPAPAFYERVPVLILMSGLIISSGVFTELYYILTAVWQMKHYYIFGYAILAVCLMVCTSMITSIITTFILLNGENHHWQWPAFLAPASTGVYCFAYCIYYFINKTRMHGVCQIVDYLAQCGLLCIAISLACGGPGFFAANIFVHNIYHNLKID